MNCAEARRLLEQGITPGAATPEQAALGFHLASCAACRTYREHLDHNLLANLLAMADQSARQAAPVASDTPISAPERTSLSRILWLGGFGVLAALLLWVVVTVALPIFHIHQNVQAMIVPSTPPATSPATEQPAVALVASPAATATLEPTLALPTAQPPSPTPPKPSATPIPTIPPPTATPLPPPPGEPVTVLLLGSDARPGESEPSRTDAIIIARIDPRLHRVALLSLPRDLWVEIPGYGQTRINAANVWGTIYNDPGGGLGLARKTVSNLLGIPIDYTVYINFEGFIGAIDSLGGVTVDVNKELYDESFPTMDYGYTVAHFLPGPQLMDGATALMYSRIRHPDSDFARMRRQQAVLVAMLTRLRDQNALQNLTSLEAVTTALRDYVKTDLPEDRILGMGWALRDFAPDQVEHYLLDEDHISFGIGEDRYAEVAQPGAIEELANKLIGH